MCSFAEELLCGFKLLYSALVHMENKYTSRIVKHFWIRVFIQSQELHAIDRLRNPNITFYFILYNSLKTFMIQKVPVKILNRLGKTDTKRHKIDEVFINFRIKYPTLRNLKSQRWTNVYVQKISKMEINCNHSRTLLKRSLLHVWVE